MADLNDQTLNVNIASDDNTKLVTVTTDGSKNRLDVDARVTPIFGTPVHAYDYDSDADVGDVLASHTVTTGKTQSVALRCEGSARSDFSQFFVIGEFEASGSSNSFQTCDSYIPYWRLVASCDTAPTSGSLTIFVERIGT